MRERYLLSAFLTGHLTYEQQASVLYTAAEIVVNGAGLETKSEGFQGEIRLQLSLNPGK